ncbi:unnamed protein product, partial [Prorocentrum cordatum]
MTRRAGRAAVTAALFAGAPGGPAAAAAPAEAGPWAGGVVPVGQVDSFLESTASLVFDEVERKTLVRFRRGDPSGLSVGVSTIGAASSPAPRAALCCFDPSGGAAVQRELMRAVLRALGVGAAEPDGAAEGGTDQPPPPLLRAAEAEALNALYATEVLPAPGTLPARVEVGVWQLSHGASTADWEEMLGGRGPQASWAPCPPSSSTATRRRSCCWALRAPSSPPAARCPPSPPTRGSARASAAPRSTRAGSEAAASSAGCPRTSGMVPLCCSERASRRWRWPPASVTRRTWTRSCGSTTLLRPRRRCPPGRRATGRSWASRASSRSRGPRPPLRPKGGSAPKAPCRPRRWRCWCCGGGASRRWRCRAARRRPPPGRAAAARRCR